MYIFKITYYPWELLLLVRLFSLLVSATSKPASASRGNQAAALTSVPLSSPWILWPLHTWAVFKQVCLCVFIMSLPTIRGNTIVYVTTHFILPTGTFLRARGVGVGGCNNTGSTGVTSDYSGPPGARDCPNHSPLRTAISTWNINRNHSQLNVV